MFAAPFPSSSHWESAAHIADDATRAAPVCAVDATADARTNPWPVLRILAMGRVSTKECARLAQ